MTRRIGIDFGTTNSVVAILEPDGRVHTQLYTLGTQQLDVFRTVLCFWNESTAGRSFLRHAAGPFAVEAYLDDPLDSRLILSMKSYLAQRSFTRTNLFGRLHTLEQLVAIFLTGLLAGEHDAAHIVAGRPVRFAGDHADDEFGEARLRAAFAACGFTEIEVALEPEAAGWRFARTLDRPATVLIGDFGGGTSDFSVMRFDPAAERRVTALGHAGIGLAGDSFDARILDQVVAPQLGRDDSYRVMGNALPIPREYFAGFARWHRLSLMRTPRILREIEEVAAASSHPHRLRSLIRLIEDEMGYPLYQTVSAVKAELSREQTATLRFSHRDLSIERAITRDEFEHWIAPELRRIALTIELALQRADRRPEQIDRVFLTGGTSLVPAVRALFAERFGAEKLSGGGEFVSVAEGLTLIGGDRALASC